MFSGRIGPDPLEVTNRRARLYVRTVERGHSAAGIALDVYNTAVIHLLYEWLIDAPVSLQAVEFAHPHGSDDGLALSLFSIAGRL